MAIPSIGGGSYGSEPRNSSLALVEEAFEMLLQVEAKDAPKLLLFVRVRGLPDLRWHKLSICSQTSKVFFLEPEVTLRGQAEQPSYALQRIAFVDSDLETAEAFASAVVEVRTCQESSKNKQTLVTSSNKGIATGDKSNTSS